VRRVVPRARAKKVLDQLLAAKRTSMRVHRGQHGEVVSVTRTESVDQDVDFRQEVAEKLGTGFEVPPIMTARKSVKKEMKVAA
jgi:hypothetical protein